jgi:hypothetical protein
VTTIRSIGKARGNHAPVAKDAANETRRLKGAEVLKDLETFVLRGNVVDLAVAVVIGAASGAVVTGLVRDLITR